MFPNIPSVPNLQFKYMHRDVCEIRLWCDNNFGIGDVEIIKEVFFL